MDDKKNKLKKDSQTKKGHRTYADPQSTLLAHPTRQQILETLKDGKKTTKELEKITGENRHYEIYQNIRKPKIPIIVETIKAYLNETPVPFVEVQSKYSALSEELKSKISKKEKLIIKLMYQRDPFSIQEPTLFDL